MEAVPRLPMIKFPMKSSVENVDFKAVLMKYIQQFYHEDAYSYIKEIEEFEYLRNSAKNAQVDFTGCQILKKYYCQILYLISRFPPDEIEEQLKFKWNSAFNEHQAVEGDLSFEMNCILYNIGSMHSALGTIDLRITSDGMKISCTHFQCAAWIYQHLSREELEHFNSNLMLFMMNISLSQSQECILEKSLTDNRKPNIIAKVAMQVVEYLRIALKNLEMFKKAPNSGEKPGSKIQKAWQHECDFKLIYFTAVALYHQGIFAEEQQNMGQRIAFYQEAVNKLDEATKLSKLLDKEKSVDETLVFSNDVIRGKLTAALKENEFVYHEKIPQFDSLPEIKGASLVKGIEFDFSDEEISGPDIFARLVPLKAHQYSSMYSEEKAKLLRRITSEISERNEELQMTLASLQIDSINLNHDVDSLPQELVDACADLNSRAALVNITEMLNKINSLSHNIQNKLSEAESMIKEEESRTREFNVIMGISPKIALSHVVLEQKREIANYSKKLEEANATNQKLCERISLHKANISSLSKPLNELIVVLPSVAAVENDNDKITRSELERLMKKVREMQEQRAHFESELRSNLHADDVTSRLVTNQGDVQSFFEENLQKHQKLVSVLEQNMSAQKNIIQALLETNAAYAETRRMILQVAFQRSEVVSSLLTSYNAFIGIMEKGEQAQKFYSELDGLVAKLHTRIKGLCTVADEERESKLKANMKNFDSKINFGKSASNSFGHNVDQSYSLKFDASQSTYGGTGSGLKLKDFLVDGKRTSLDSPRINLKNDFGSNNQQNLHTSYSSASVTSKYTPVTPYNPQASAPSTGAVPQYGQIPYDSSAYNTGSNFPSAPTSSNFSSMEPILPSTATNFSSSKTNVIPTQLPAHNYSTTGHTSHYSATGQNVPYNPASTPYSVSANPCSNTNPYSAATVSYNLYNVPKNPTYPYNPVTTSSFSTVYAPNSIHNSTTHPTSFNTTHSTQKSIITSYNPAYPAQNVTSNTYNPTHHKQTFNPTSSIPTYPTQNPNQTFSTTSAIPTYPIQNPNQTFSNTSDIPTFPTQNPNQTFSTTSAIPTYPTQNPNQTFSTTSAIPTYPTQNLNQTFSTTSAIPTFPTQNPNQTFSTTSAIPTYPTQNSVSTSYNSPYPLQQPIATVYNAAYSTQNIPTSYTASTSTPYVSSNSTQNTFYRYPTADSFPCNIPQSLPVSNNTVSTTYGVVPTTYSVVPTTYGSVSGINSFASTAYKSTPNSYAPAYYSSVATTYASVTKTTASATSGSLSSTPIISGNFPQHNAVTNQIAYPQQSTGHINALAQYNQPSALQYMGGQTLSQTTSALDKRYISGSITTNFVTPNVEPGLSYAQTTVANQTFSTYSSNYSNQNFSVQNKQSTPFNYNNVTNTGYQITPAISAQGTPVPVTHAISSGQVVASGFNCNQYGIPQNQFTNGVTTIESKTVPLQPTIAAVTPAAAVPTSVQNSLKTVTKNKENMSNLDLLSDIDISQCQAEFSALTPESRNNTKECTKHCETTDVASKNEVVGKETGHLLPATGASTINTNDLNKKNGSDLNELFSNPNAMLNFVKSGKNENLRRENLDPLGNEDILNCFIAETERLLKLIQGLDKKSLCGLTNLEMKWKEFTDKLEVQCSKLNISVGRCYPLKNRFSDNLSFDATRVVLPVERDDYINASFVHLKSVEHSVPLIVTQAPMPNTFADFWTMIWENQVELIVCLNSDVEVKNQLYFPVNDSDSFESGNFIVTVKASRPNKMKSSSWIQRTFYLKNKTVNSSKALIHMQFVNWPPGEIPDSPCLFLHFINDVHELQKQQRNKMHPMVVHCVSGTGRSGVFSVLSSFIKCVEETGILCDIWKLMLELCQQRRSAIQDSRHCLFLLSAALYYAQELLMKRGISVEKNTFGESTREKKHTRHPSADLLFTDLSRIKMELGLENNSKIAGISESKSNHTNVDKNSHSSSTDKLEKAPKSDERTGVLKLIGENLPEKLLDSVDPSKLFIKDTNTKVSDDRNSENGIKFKNDGISDPFKDLDPLSKK